MQLVKLHTEILNFCHHMYIVHTFLRPDLYIVSEKYEVLHE